MLERVTFERPRVEPNSLLETRNALTAAHRVALTGAPGTGRSWVVGQLHRPEGRVLSLRFGTQLDRGETALAQAARVLRTSAPLRALVEQGLEAGIDAVDQATNGWTVIADDADALMSTGNDDGWEDPEGNGLLQVANARWREWLSGRSGPTLVVGRRAVDLAGWTNVSHAPPKQWPIKLVQAEGGFRDWQRLAEILGHRPDRLFLAAAVVPLITARQFASLVDDPSSTLLELGRLLRVAAPTRAVALDFVATLDGDPVDVVEDALTTVSDDPRAVLDDLHRANLVTVTADRIEVCAAVRESGAASPIEPAAAAKAAVALLASVNRPDSLEPSDASRVLAVHRLAVIAEDRELALRTSTLHVYGLIELARRESMVGQYAEATRTYGKIRSMLDDSPARVLELDRVRSYVSHYHAWNGIRAETMPLDTALAESAEAVGLWPENARWHGLQIELLIAMGRPVDAKAALSRAEKAVADHPQRARHLRVRPARQALQFGFVRLCLELVEDATPTWLDDAEALAMHRSVRTRLKTGVLVAQAALDDAMVVFLRPVPIRLVRLTHQWEASISDLARAVAPVATKAYDGALRRLADETRSLITIPTPQLKLADAARKGLLLSVIDVLNSDIGLEHRPDRFVLGRVEAGQFVPVQDDLPEMDLADPPSYGSGLWFAHVAVQRDGWPVKVLDLVPAGSGRSVAELREVLEQLRRG